MIFLYSNNKSRTTREIVCVPLNLTETVQVEGKERFCLSAVGEDRNYYTLGNLFLSLLQVEQECRTARVLYRHVI